MILWRASLRYFLRHPWQMALSVLGVAIGVAVVAAVDLANASAQRAFVLSIEALSGSVTHQIVGGPNGVPEEIYRELRLRAEAHGSMPIIEGYATASLPEERSFRIIGVDPLAGAATGPYLPSPGSGTDFTRLLTEPATGLLARETAQRLGLGLNGRLPLEIRGVQREVILAGLLDARDEAARQALAATVIVDIATAQELLGMRGRLSRIDLIVPEGAAGDAQLARIRAVLPPGVELLRARTRTASMTEMTRAFQLNLNALSLLALIVGAFLIYNTMTFSVLQRRPLIGTLRTLGVTKREVFGLVLGEALLIGLAGTLLGLALGLVLADSLLGLVTRTINDLYFTLTVRELTLAPASLAKALALGLGATVLAALAPAREATQAPPVTVLSRSTVEARARRRRPWMAAAGALALLLGAAVLLVPSSSLLLSYAGLLAIIAGFALLTPAVTVALMQTLRPAVGVLFGVLGRMAARGVIVSLSRTGVAVAALAVAIAATIGMAIMIGSFRTTVAHWLGEYMHADIYVVPAGQDSTPGNTSLDPALVARLRETSGVAAMTSGRYITIESAQGLTELNALDIGPKTYAAFRFKEGSPAALWPAFQQEDTVIVSEPYAYHHNLHAGDMLALRTDRGRHDFRIVGVFYHYGTSQGVVMMSRRTYNRYWDDPRIGSVGIYAAPGTDVETLVDALRRHAAGYQPVTIRSNRTLREASLAIFDRTFAITSVLRALVMVVAFIGILSALMAIQLERARELAVLRANGLTPRQLWGLVSAETGLMGTAAGLLAIPQGIVLALVLIYVVNLRSFGWTMQMVIDPTVLIQGMLLAVGAALLAGLYPALRMARTPPALALRSE